MSKVDKILKDELDPKDPDPTPRGGKNGRNSGGKSGSRFLQGLGERIGIAGIAVFTLGAALAGCVPDTGKPKTAPTCDEPASWCRGEVAR